MLVVIDVIAGVLGLAIGSFLNVVIHRVPNGASLTRPPSACPSCGHEIRWFDNVPVVSWLVLRGRCRDCGARIPIRYPLVELAGGIAFALVALCFAPGGWLAPIPLVEQAAEGGGVETSDPAGTLAVAAQFLVLVALLWFAAASIALVAIDLEVRRLPDAIVYPTIAVLAVLLAAAGALTGDLAGILRALVGGAASVTFYLVVRFASRGGMGRGDVKLAAAVGLVTAWIGWGGLVVGVLAAFVLGGVFGIALLAARRAGRRSAIPFGPWMLAGAWIGVLAGPGAWNWYLGVLGFV